MNGWWKSPVLQVPENDYGEYDYLIEEIPSNSTEWSWWYETCDHCGKEHKLNLVFTGCFRTLDGWDSMAECECWKCYLKRKITAPFKKIKRKIKMHVRAREEVYELNKCYKKIAGKPLPKERREKIYKIFTKENLL